MGFIKNKPFYDTRKSEPLIIEWDGNTDGKESFYLATNKNTYYKISENVPSYDEVLQGEGTFYANATGEEGSTQEIPFSLVETTTKITDSNGNNVWMVEVVDGVALIIVPNSFDLGEMKATRGIWAFHIYENYDDGTTVNGFIKSLYFPSITKGELKTIDPKYLPTPLDLYWDSVGTWLYANAECTEKAKVADYQSAVASGRQIRVLQKYDSDEFLHITPIYHMVQDGQVVFVLPKMGEGDDGNGGVEMRFVFALIDG